MRSLLRCVVVIAGLAGLSAPVMSAPDFDAGRPGWTSVELGASKFLMTGRARVTLEELPASQLAGELRSPPAGVPVAPGERILRMRNVASLAGQRTDMTLLLDPATAATLQIQLRDSGRRYRQRILRFTDIGAWHWTVKPAAYGEKALEPQAWTNRSEGMRPYGKLTGTGAVTDATALVYGAAAAPLAKPGDRFGLQVYSRRRMHNVVAEHAGFIEVNADYMEKRAGQPVRRKGRIKALNLQISGAQSPDGDDDDERVTLLGLSGALSLALDPVTRAPLQLTGDAPIVGRVTFRLKAVTLR
ncbi:MAG: hypothetical protein FJ197_04785 [Gammaproteobacteria bacterium]|nr:hypothetical protein [Gammaproteobacteria bacterium]